MNKRQLREYMDLLLDELCNDPLCNAEQYKMAKAIVVKIRGKLNNDEK